MTQKLRLLLGFSLVAVAAFVSGCDRPSDVVAEDHAKKAGPRIPAPAKSEPSIPSPGGGASGGTMISAQQAAADLEAVAGKRPEVTGPSTITKIKVIQKQELQQIITLSRALRVYALDHEGAYPADIQDQEILDGLGEAGSLFEFKHAKSGEVGRPLFVKGTSAESSPSHVLLASPWAYMGKRAVVYCDGSGKIIEEAEYQKHLGLTLGAGGMEVVK